ncbi:MAG: cytochrome b/b6 domain-containing protein [Ginsengibacter sp.]
MKRAVKKHPLAIRWFHWINFPILGVMIWSGMLIYWANDIYKIGFGNKTILKFFPQSFYDALHIPFRLAEGMSLHFVFMWIFAINGFIYVLYLIFSGQWRYIFPDKKSFKESLIVVLHDLHLTKKVPAQKKYNAAQRITYTIVIFMGLGSVLSGLSIYKPVQLGWLTSLLGGYEWARVEHFTLTILFTLFFLVHILQVILAGWNNFQSMVTGLFVVPYNKKILIPAVVPVQELQVEEKQEIHENIEPEKQKNIVEKTISEKDNVDPDTQNIKTSSNE